MKVELKDLNGKPVAEFKHPRTPDAIRYKNVTYLRSCVSNDLAIYSEGIIEEFGNPDLWGHPPEGHDEL